MYYGPSASKHGWSGRLPKCRQVNGERNEGGTGMLCRVGPIKPVPADMVVAGHVSGLLIRNLN